MDEDRECNTCASYDPVEGRCGLKDIYVHGYDGQDCPDWSDWETRAIFGKGRRVKAYD